jgi:hypothetical protein
MRIHGHRKAVIDFCHKKWCGFQFRQLELSDWDVLAEVENDPVSGGRVAAYDLSTDP